MKTKRRDFNGIEQLRVGYTRSVKGGVPKSTLYVGHVLDVLRRMKAESVSCVVTSPPYWSLRKYDAPDADWDGWKGQLGLEPTPKLFVEHTMEWLRVVMRVLRKDGVCWLNIGDGYAGGGSGQQATKEGKGGLLGGPAAGSIAIRHNAERVGLAPKQLVLMPERIALAAQADGWWVRKRIVWSKPNAMPESATDRPTSAHETIWMLTKSKDYWYDQEAVREATGSEMSWGEYEEALAARRADGNGKYVTYYSDAKHAKSDGGRSHPAGRNMRDVWVFPTAQTPEAHFATFPEELPKRCIKASCPSDGVVLDPFLGIGTTGVVARRLGREFVGIELSEKYAAIAERKIRNYIERRTAALKPDKNQIDLFT